MGKYMDICRGIQLSDLWLEKRHSRTINIPMVKSFSRSKGWIFKWRLVIASTYRSSHRRCSVKKGVLRNFAKLTVKHLCQRLFFNKVTGLRPDYFFCPIFGFPDPKVNYHLSNHILLKFKYCVYKTRKKMDH